jgi:2-keto-4-pentenoate hydratase/2-oxohepta-3-ene-1,7-dioic acid hydratase in catechol pathway
LPRRATREARDRASHAPDGPIRAAPLGTAMKVLCVGSNYAHHVAELGGRPAAAPVWFWKPDTAIVGDGDAVRIPTDVGAIHHEVELAVRIAEEGGPAVGRPAVPGAFTVAVDVTARDLQNADKKAGRPWQQAKGYDTFLPLGAWQPIARADDGRADAGRARVDLQDLRLRLSLDGEVKQDGSTAAMTWPVAELLQLAAQWTTLRPGDVMLTGTPAGVGPIAPGQEMVAEVVGHVAVTNRVVAR